MATVSFEFVKDYTAKKVITETVVTESTLTIDDLQMEKDMLLARLVDLQTYTDKRVGEIDKDIAEIQKLGVPSQKAVVAEEKRVALEAELAKINEEPVIEETPIP